MTTLKPQLIRADTLDLQDHDSPSAQDHPRHSQPAPLGAGPAAPHQQQSLRHIEAERTAEREHLNDAWGSHASSGRSSHEGSELLDQDMRMSSDETRIDEAALEQDGGDRDITQDEETGDMLDDRGSSSPSIDDNEEIDPDFVYALHNFIATVEGQANAAKGDAMVLLDDTNSYWWLVRLVKDSSIGYLPAEHIELPVERSARQNKHRNIELTSRHLTDENTGKTRNPLKKAMRRRNAKKVEFTTPQYYDPDPAEWSEEETDLAEGQTQMAGEVQQQHNGQQQQELSEDDYNRQTDAESVDYRQDQRYDDNNATLDPATSNGDSDGDFSQGYTDQNSMAQKTSRTGTVRNTDSFYADNTAEPRKISLTPNLLREESGDLSNRSSASTDKGSTNQDLFAELDNASPTSEKGRENLKRKDKKPGMLRGLFGRKEKKIKVDEAVGGTVIKTDTEPTSPTTPTGGRSPVSTSSPTSPQNRRPNSGGKLQKAPPANVLNPTNNTPKSPTEIQFTPGPSLLQPSRPAPVPPAGVKPAESSTQPVSSNQQPADSRYLNDGSYPEVAPLRWHTPQTMTTSSSSNLERGTTPQPGPSTQGTTSETARDGQYTSEIKSAPGEAANVNAPPISPATEVPELQGGDRDAGASSGSSTSRSVSPPSPLEEPSSTPRDTPTTPMTERSVSQDPEKQQKQDWDAAGLAPYFDGRNKQYARDLLLIVNDHTGVKPLPLDHPTMLQFGFHEHQRQLNDMSQRLDSLLNGFLARKAARPKQARQTAQA